MLTFEDLLAEHMKNPEFRKEWEALEEEYKQENARIEAEIAADKAAGIERFPRYPEDCLAWMKDYKTSNA